MEELQLTPVLHNMIPMPNNHLRSNMVGIILRTRSSRVPILLKATIKAMALHPLITTLMRNSHQVLMDRQRRVDIHHKALMMIRVGTLPTHHSKERMELQRINMVHQQQEHTANISKHHRS